jgi:hypothetical protein
VDVYVVLGCLALLYWWSRDRHREQAARQAERASRCPHEPEWQETCRVNNIMTHNPALLHAVIPGRRWLVKRCRGCGREQQMYAPTLQPFDEFMAEFDQETIDRAAQLQARTQAHINSSQTGDSSR